jgi:hypothetical protein
VVVIAVDKGAVDVEEDCGDRHSSTGVPNSERLNQGRDAPSCARGTPYGGTPGIS